MRIFCDTADLNEIVEWDLHPWVSGFTTNPTLIRQYDEFIPGHTLPFDAWEWARKVVELTDKPVSIDGPPKVWDLGPNVWRKVTDVPKKPLVRDGHINHTAICRPEQIKYLGIYRSDDIISVFAGRIMDTGRDPIAVIDAAKATGAQVLWASVREPYNIVMAEDAGCDIVTVPPAILRKYLDWHGKPLEVVAEETIAQFEKDSEGLW